MVTRGKGAWQPLSALTRGGFLLKASRAPGIAHRRYPPQAAADGGVHSPPWAPSPHFLEPLSWVPCSRGHAVPAVFPQKASGIPPGRAWSTLFLLLLLPHSCPPSRPNSLPTTPHPALIHSSVTSCRTGVHTRLPTLALWTRPLPGGRPNAL